MKRLAAVLIYGAVLWGQREARDQGAAALRAGQLAEAERLLRQAVRAQPQDAQAQKLLGMTLAARENLAAAEVPFRVACRLAPADDSACYYLGRWLFTTGRLPEAAQVFRQVLGRFPRHGRAHHGLALVLEAQGAAADAEREYRAALQAGEGKAAADLGLLLARTGRGAEAVKLLEQAGDRPTLARVRTMLRAAPPASVGEVAAVQFTRQELPMVLRTGGTGRKHLPETMLGGIAVLDYDRDGWPDLFFANGAPLPSAQKASAADGNRLFRNNRDGTFTDVTTQAGLAGTGYDLGAAAGDFDGDGRTDLYVAGLRGQALYRNRGDGTFTDVTVRAGLPVQVPWSIGGAWLDYDRDGHLDLFVVRYVQWDAATEPSCGGPGEDRTFCHPRLYEPLANVLYRNKGDGTFEDVSVRSGIAAHRGKGMSVTVGDANGDGLPDLFVANDTMPNFLFRNNGDGTLTEIAQQAGVALNDDGQAVSAMGAEFADFDQDGRDDIVVTALTNEGYSLYRQTAPGTFFDVRGPSGLLQASRAWTGWGVVLADLNNDGRRDLFIAQGHVMDNAERTSSRQSKQANLLLLNAGGRFVPSLLPGTAFHRGLVRADLDRDGRLDLVVTRLNQSPVILWNRTPDAGHWLRLRVDAIGARVKVASAQGTQWGRVSAAVSYASSSELTLHFGLGKDSIADVTVEWPDGARQEWRALAADREHHLTRSRATQSP